MNWAWASSLDHLWRSPAFPVWLTLAAAGFFAIIVLVALLRADRSVANGALAVITLLAGGIAVAAATRGFEPGSRVASPENRPPQPLIAAFPALSCIDDLAGETVLTACEKALFSSPESTAAALSYAAGLVTRLTAFGDVAAANASMTPDLLALRRAVERDRYGLMAYVLAVRDHCTPAQCTAFPALTDHRQIATNMEERAYDGLVARYAAAWNAPVATAPVAALAPTLPTGKPTNADFPTAASTPPVSIMTPEPAAASAPRPPAPAASAPSPRPPALAAAKKQPAAPKSSRAPGPVPLTPPGAAAPAPTAENQ